MACVRKNRGRWVVDWRAPNGRRFIEVQPDKRAAELRLAEIIKAGKAPASKRISFKDRAEWWLQNVAKPNLRGSTFQEYQSVLTNHVYPLLGAKPFVRVDRSDIRNLAAVKQTEGLSHSTIRNILAPVRGIFFQAIDDGIVHSNPAARSGVINKRPKDAGRVSIEPLDREEVQALLETAAEKMPAVYPLLLCACRAGLRQGELIALKAGDIDFHGSFIEVRRNLSRGQVTTPKNGKTRRVDLSQQLAATLKELLSKRRADALRREMEKPGSKRRDAAAVVEEIASGWLFQTAEGTQLDPSNLRKVFGRALVTAGLRSVRFHDLRHTFASLLIAQGESLAYVKEQMGHSSINVTVDIYGHLVPGGNRQAVNQLDDAPKRSAKKRKLAK